MAQLPIFAVTVHGGAPAPRAVAAGDTSTHGAGYEAEFHNGGGAPMTVTVACHGFTAVGDVLADKAYTVPAAGDQRIPLNLPEFRDPTDGLVHFSYSTTTTVTGAVTHR